MGLDGGTIITRSDVLRGQCWDLSTADNSRSTRGGAVTGTHKRAKIDRKIERRTKWTTCALSEQPLQPPIVADRLGNLYNRTAVLEFLLARAGHFEDTKAQHRFFNQIRSSGAAFDHLQSKRDIFDISLPPASQAVYRCPISDVPADTYPFSALSTCGHVFSDRALHQMKEETCSMCCCPFNQDSMIPINGTPEQVEALIARLLASRRERPHKRKQKVAAIGSASEPKRLKAAQAESTSD